MTRLPRNTILEGDALARLQELPTAAVDCIVSSPPYYQLRDYGVEGQIGLEPTVERWVEALRPVLRELARVVKPTGSLWLNLADSYSSHPRYGAPPKSLLLGPERMALAMASDGWILRNKVIWAKANPMPHSVADRLNTTHEVLYLAVRTRTYYFDLDSIREPHRSLSARREQPAPRVPEPWAGPLAAGTQSGLRRARPAGQPGHALGKNPGDVWYLPTRGYPGAHFATFPPALIHRPILATCPERICEACGAPWRRHARLEIRGKKQPIARDRFVRLYPGRWETIRKLGPLRPGCTCGAGFSPGIVLDPFFGAGTVGLVAQRLKRDWLGIELNPVYVQMARRRLAESRARSKPESVELAA